MMSPDRVPLTQKTVSPTKPRWLLQARRMIRQTARGRDRDSTSQEGPPVPRLTKLRRPGHGEKLGAAWRIVWLVLYAPVSALIKVRYRNLERFPQQGAAIVVVNHVSHVDPFIVSK